GFRTTCSNCIIRVIRDLMPGIKIGLVVSVVWIKCRDNPLQRIVEQNRADADHIAEFELMRIIEERLILTNGLALVVVYGPARADPPRINYWTAINQGSCFCLNFLL